MLSQSRFSTAEEVAWEIEDYWDATEEFSRDDKGQAGSIAPVGEDPVKGGKHGGKSKGKGKLRTRIPTRVGELATMKRSVGLNKST